MNAQAPTDHVLEQILDKARAARDGHFDVLSTGEKLTVALVLNQPELLSKMGYTMAEAVERVGPEWMAKVPEAARVLEHEVELAAEAAAIEQARERNRRGMDIGL
ncbi:hypothetical protein ACSBPQ_10935 [Stenotrophomonas sp. JC08]|uniref:hypothetical protein n=1 Tax=Stenotrophomonas sp. JC08 TaxID=3445779 RepID=UPI003FA315B0